MALVVRPACQCGDVRDSGLIPQSGRFPGGRNDNPLQYSCLGNPMDRGDWWATVYRVTKTWTWLSDLAFYKGTYSQNAINLHSHYLLLKCVTLLHPTPVLLPGKSHGRRSLVGCSPWGHEESDMTEWLHFHFSLSCIGEGNGNPLQCSCLENPRDRGAWWASIYGVAQNWTRLKRLSSSSNDQFRLSLWLCCNAKQLKRHIRNCSISSFSNRRHI